MPYEIVAVEKRVVSQVVDNHIEVAIAVQVDERRPTRIGRMAESPGCGHIFKGQIGIVSVQIIGHMNARQFLYFAQEAILPGLGRAEGIGLE